MSILQRQTARLTLSFEKASEEMRSLDTSREYQYTFKVEDRELATGMFKSPLGDEDWRRFIDSLRTATSVNIPVDRPITTRISSAGAKLFEALSEASLEVSEFLADFDRPRRLVISSACPEIHRLPWEAMVDIREKPWKSVAEGNLSIVHTTEPFNSQPAPVPQPFTIHSFFGPETERVTRPTLEALQRRAENSSRIRVLLGSGETSEDAAGLIKADLLHIEAHGDNRSGNVDMGTRNPLDTDVFDQLDGRSVVLLWSCHSGFVHPWGKSLAMRLHEQRNKFVLSFVTPLRFDTCREVAQQFYDLVFRSLAPLDAETFVVEQRSQWFQKRRPAGDWASMTLWMREPPDLSAAVLNGPRISVSLPGDKDHTDRVPSDIESDLQERLMPGRPVLRQGIDVTDRIGERLFEKFTGTVVHLRSEHPDMGLPQAIASLSLSAPSKHPADQLLSLYDYLSSYPGSLLICSGVNENLVNAFGLLGEFPPAVSLMLVSREAIPVVGRNFAVYGTAPRAAAPTGNPAHDSLAHLQELESQGEYAQAVKQWKELKGRYRPDTADFVSFQRVGYWCYIRLNYKVEAKECADAIEKLDPFEWHLLQGNFDQRDGRYRETERHYRDALQSARDAKDGCRVGRAALELAYMSAEIGDREMAARIYGEALANIEAYQPAAGEAQWASALGRALRDYSDFVATWPNRAEESAKYLRRALFIHAFDGRASQLGPVLRTRSKLARAKGDWAKAETDLQAAAAILHRSGNQEGWTEAIGDLADLAIRQGRFTQAERIAGACLKQLEKGPNPRDKQIAGMRVLSARAAWNAGDFAGARQHAKVAIEVFARLGVPRPPGFSEMLSLLKSLEGE